LAEQRRSRAVNVAKTLFNSEENKMATGQGWHGDSEAHAAAGRIGGSKVSANREHMAKIGRKGGLAVSADRGHMKKIGSRGGLTTAKAKTK
jgi:general stress protein YciG